VARKIIQISGNEEDSFRALADDGAIWDVSWYKHADGKCKWEWVLIPSVPQEPVGDCPKCGARLVINKPSGTGFCTMCEYRIGD